MNLSEVMRTAGSTRALRPDPIPLDLIFSVLDDARFASSGRNLQGWRVIVVSDPEIRAQLCELYRRGWNEFHAPLFAIPGEPPVRNEYAEHLDQVPVQLVVLVEQAALETTIPALDESHHVGGASIYPFVQNIILGLRARGVGTALTTVLIPVESQVKDLLGIPDGYALAAHLGIGLPLKPFPNQLSRRPVEEFATVDRFNGSALCP